MKKIICLLLVIATIWKVEAQEIPVGSCGLIITYDAAGNRIKRQYFCNNGTAPYPTAIKKSEVKEISEVQMVDALYPNPTTGKFSVYFSKTLKSVMVMVSDVNGKVIRRFNASGNRVDFDLSSVTNGVYFIQVHDNGNTIIKKVVKQ